MCKPFGLQGQVWCDKITDKTPIESSFGLTGYKFYLRKVFGFFGPRETPEVEGIVGPVLAYDVSKQTNNEFREVEITFDLINYPNAAMDPTILDGIGNSLHFNK